MPEVNRFSRAALIVSVVLPAAAQMDVDVLTNRYDNARSGVNLRETQLKKSNVKKNTFGKLAFRIVDGNIYAQPLIVTKAQVVGHQTDVVIVATEHNSVYAFDANDVAPEAGGHESAKALWHTGPTGPNGLGESVDSLELSGKIGAGNCTDLTTEIGITGTPVIKLTHETAPKEGVIFVVAKSKSGTQFNNKLFALNLADGQPLGDGMPIEGSVAGPNGMITFDPLFQLNRPALLLDNNVLYIAFGGHCDSGSYRGWLFAYDVSNPATPQKIDAFSTTFAPRSNNNNDKEGRGGIWMSGFGPAAMDGGVFFSSGDGTYNVTDPDFLNLSDSVVKVALESGKINVKDWYSPQNRDDLKKFDADLGSAGAVPVPGTHLMLAGGKEGRLYLIDRDHMGRGVDLSLHSFQVTNPRVNRMQNPGNAGEVLYWNIHGARWSGLARDRCSFTSWAKKII